MENVYPDAEEGFTQKAIAQGQVYGNLPGKSIRLR
jgi:hypothetical protein